MYQVKQSSTTRPLIFLMVDSTDHVTGKTGLTPTVTISKNGAAFGSPSGAVSAIANGFYMVAGNATDTNTLGPLVLHATGTAADPTDVVYDCVLDLPGVAQTGDGFARLGAPVGASHSADVAAVKTDTAAISAKTTNLPTDPADASDIAASFSTVNATLATISGKTAALPSDPADASDIAASFATVNATLATINGAIDTEVAAIKAKTDNLPASPAATGDAMTLTAGERTATADALLNRNMAAVTVTNTRSPINALRILRNKVSVPLGTVFAEDDSTTAWTFAVTTDAAAIPITTVDPA